MRTYELSFNVQVYCGTYGKYNNGSIKGAWLDLREYEDYEEFVEACKELHKDEEDPEFMFQDTDQKYEIFDGEPSLSEIEDFYEIVDKSDNEDEFFVYMAGLDPQNGSVYESWKDYVQYDIEYYEGLMEAAGIPTWMLNTDAVNDNCASNTCHMELANEKIFVY